MKTYQVRLCKNSACGLRYPILEGENFGIRCPACLGETEAVLSRDLILENSAARPLTQTGPNVLLDNVRSSWNVGSILRSAEGLGFSHAFLCGISATPESAAVRKTSLGAEKTVSWSLHPNGARLASELKRERFHLLALETRRDAQNIRDWLPGALPASHIVLVLGSEVTGIDPGILGLAHEIICLPMLGQKQSFNVAVAFGIAAYQLRLKLNDQSAE
jgi:tRNA G18 (ribose-2'-O)-methylase SpoU